MKRLSSSITRCIITLVIVMVFDTLFCRLNYAGGRILPGNRYKIITPVYLMGVYNSLNDRRISKDAARAYLHDQRYANRSFVAFQEKVPAGTIMTIMSPAPKVWHLFFFPERYFVKLKPDLSRGLDVILELNRGMEGALDGLNPEIFNRVQ